MIFKLITAIVLFAPLSFIPIKKDDTLTWSESRKLTWSDFKSQPDNNSTNAALTSSKTTFQYSYDSEKGFSFTISCVFDKNSSWGKVKTEYILSHEQGHFDIAEINARKLNKALKAYTFNNATVSKDVPAIYQKIMQEQAEMQQQYDDETNYSRNKEEQALWLEKIKKELDKMKVYAGYH